MRSRFSFLPALSVATAIVSILLIPDSVSAQRIVLRNVVIHGTQHTNILQPSFVVINDGKIESIGTLDARAKIDQNIDLKGAFLFPGLIALNTALGLSEISGARPTRDIQEVGEYTPDVQSWIAVNPDSDLLPVARANGITYIQPAPKGGMVAGQSGLIALDGWTMEQMAIQKPLALHVYWPSMALNTTPKDKVKDASKWKSLEDQSKERKKKVRELNEFFEDARAYAKSKAAQKDQKSFARNPAWESMLPYVAGELPVMIHADEVRQIKAAVNWGETNQLKIIIAGGRDAWMIADELAEKKVPVLYEHTFTQPVRDSVSYDVHFKAPTILHQAGVPYAIGMGATTFDAALIKNVPYQAAQSIGFGLPREEALKAITLYPAQMIGMADRIGSIDVGKDATFFTADGDILDIRTNVKRVWIAGKEVSLDNRHTRLYEKYKDRPKQN
ncbi:MAG: amidohydrolase family protein [Verrucomicrobia bacterium]|nr:amidohydrolase family protein [Verrucomicrobiota bacterium]